MADTNKPKPTDPKSSDTKEDSESEDSDWDYDYDPQNDTDDEVEADSDSNPYFYDENAPPEYNRQKLEKFFNSKKFREIHEENDELLKYDDRRGRFDFPVDHEKWSEEDLREMWADPPLVALTDETGWDPARADDDDFDDMKVELEAGNDPPIAPFYLPYRKHYPAVPRNHHDLKTPEAVIEELDRIEEFMRWASYIFEDGSSYEGTVWDDMAHGRGVFVADHGLLRYEGEWFQNDMDGHGVVEVDVPDIQPVPGSKLEAKMRAQGKMIDRDYMEPEDRKWLEMDIEDSFRFANANGLHEIPYYERVEWIQKYGKKPETGRYRYAGEWKHGKMHGCGVYEVNERILRGRFYFGKLLYEDDYGCDAKQCALHSGIAEVAAAKARMFINKPDGMVREMFGPYSDPQHPYLYEEEDVWMAPGFVNQFFEVPEFWEQYVQDVDEEREMWLNSFYKAPLRLPMPAELSYLWENDEPDEFVLVNKGPEPDPEDPSKLIYTEDPLILHTPSGQYINYVEDEKYGIRLFWQPILKEGEKVDDVDPDKVVFLPVGEDLDQGGNAFTRFFGKVQNALTSIADKLTKYSEEKKREAETKIRLTEKKLELIDAELDLNEAIEDFDEELKEMANLQDMEVRKKMEKKMQKKTQKKPQKEEKTENNFKGKDDKVLYEEKNISSEKEDEDEDEDDDEDEGMGSSFGSVMDDEDLSKDEQKGNGKGNSPFAASSLSVATRSFVSTIPLQLQLSFSKWKEMKSHPKKITPSYSLVHSAQMLTEVSTSPCSLSFPSAFEQGLTLRTMHRTNLQGKPISKPSSRNRTNCKESTKFRVSVNEFTVLSLHTPINTCLL